MLKVNIGIVQILILKYAFIIIENSLHKIESWETKS